MLLRLFLKSLLLLLGVTFAEKGLFALYHSELSAQLGSGELLATLLWGIRFDLAISALFALLLLLGCWLAFRLGRVNPASFSRWGSFIAATTLILLHGADLLYYSEAGRHLGYELLEGYNSGGDLATAALRTYTLPVALQLALIVPLYFLSRRLFAARPAATAGTLRQRSFHPELQLAAALLLAVVMVRGGLQAIPLEPLHAQEIGDSRRATLALNGAYNALHASLASRQLRPLISGEPTAHGVALVQQIYRDAKLPAAPASGQQPNVVIVLLESWSAPYMQSYGYTQQTTPHFDALREESLTTLGMVAGGHRTTEGMFATLCSWQNPLGQTVAQSQLQNFDYRCLPRLLKEQGYHSAFFQGTYKNTSGTGAFAQLLGFEQGYGREDIPTHRLPYTSWGLHDPDIYDFVLQKMAQLPQPFLIGINSNSTHAAELPPGFAPPFDGSDSLTTYLNLLHFSDAALHDFITAVKRNPAFANTIFVLVADHTGHTPGGTMQKYEVPFLIHAPGLIAPQRLDAIASQRDIAPTLQALLMPTAPAPFSGVSLLAATPQRYADYYHQGLLGWVEGRRGIETGLTPASPLRCFAFDAAAQQQSESPCTPEDEVQRQRALAFTQLSQQLLFSGKVAQFAAGH